MNSKILVIEDNPSDRDFFTIALDRARVVTHEQVHFAETAEHALAYINSCTDFPSLILLDISLPGMNGLKLLEELREDPRIKGIPVLILSGSKAPLDVVRAYQAKANGYIEKTADVDKFTQDIVNLYHYWFETNKQLQV